MADTAALSENNNDEKDLTFPGEPACYTESLEHSASFTEVTNAGLDNTYTMLADQTFTIDSTNDLPDLSDSGEFDDSIKDLYINRGYYERPVLQPFATIFEEPKGHVGDEIVFSKIKRYRHFDFSEGSWYRVPNTKLKQRIRKARKNGWRPNNKNGVNAEELYATLERLDLEDE